MLTRGQVARCLGKSIATVRRLEGVLLHPWVDDAGVHRFCLEEVEQARKASARVREPLASQWIAARAEAQLPTGERPSEVDKSRHELEDALRSELALAHRRVVAMERARDQVASRELRLIRLHQQALDEIERVVSTFLEALSPKQVQCIGAARLEELVVSLSHVADGGSDRR